MSNVYVVSYLRSSADGWPFDVGDDPSFLASASHRTLGGRLSWGVCRQDVRNNSEPGDLVVFFACDRLALRKPARYHFVGFATVDEKVSQVDIWQRPELAVYQAYRNLLIKPQGARFEHFEPETERLNRHKDWLWRVINTKGWRKAQLADLQRSNCVCFGSPVAAQMPQVAANYVQFEPEGRGTFVLAEPPTVAYAKSARERETWASDPIAQGVYDTVLRPASRQFLRTSNPQQPHRHIIIRDANSEKWRERLHLMCERHGLRPRTI